MGIKFLRLIDKFFFGGLNFLFSWVKFFPLNKKNNSFRKSRKILVIRLWALGSSILTFPMIRQLQDSFGEDVEYDILTTNRTISIFKNQKYFSNYINLFSLKDLFKIIFSFKKYDIVIDTEEYFNVSSLVSLWLGKNTVGYGELFLRKMVYNYPVKYNDKNHACLAYLDLLKPLGVEIRKPKYLEKFKYSEKNKIKVENFFNKGEKFFGYKKICFHTGGAETNLDRFWSNENWVKLINNLNNKEGDKIVIFLSGTNFEEKGVLEILKKIKNKNCNVINICNKFNLQDFAYFLENCDLMVSNDTGPMHLSACMGTKTIGLFGPNLPKRFGAYPLEENINLYKGDGKATIDVHLGKFLEDENNFVNKIGVDEVYKEILKSLGK